MATDSFTEITNQSYFSRIGGSLKGILFGLVLVLIAFGLLFWNEGRAVKRYKTLLEGESMVVSVSAAERDPAMEGKLIHLSGMAESAESLTDEQLGVVSPQSIKLKRTVKMYQWQESSETKTEKKLGGGEQQTTTYTYSTEWAEKPIASSSFKKQNGHQNPTTMPFSTMEFSAKQVHLGVYILNQSLISKIDSYKPFTINQDTPVPHTPGRNGHLETYGFYIGNSAASPEVGDLQIGYQVVKPLDVSVVAVQAGNSLKPYHSESGGQIEMLQTGIHMADAMFQQAQKNNTIMTWLIRVGGFLLMFFGIKLILAPLSVFADIIPAVGSLIGAGTGIIAFLFSGVFSFLTIAIAWIVFRPLIGIIALVISGALVFFIINRMKKSESSQAGSSPPPPPPPPPG